MKTNFPKPWILLFAFWVPACVGTIVPPDDGPAGQDAGTLDGDTDNQEDEGIDAGLSDGNTGDGADAPADLPADAGLDAGLDGDGDSGSDDDQPDAGPDGTDDDPLDDEVLPAEMLFFDSFEGEVNAGGTHGWTRIWAMDCDWNPFNYVSAIAQSTRFNYVTSHVRFGDTAFQVTVHDGDQVTDSDQWGGNERAEISRRYHADTGEGTDGDERWYGLSFLIDSDFPAMPSNAASIITQFLKENNSSAPYPNPTIDIRIKYRSGTHRLEVYNRKKVGGSWQVQLHDIGPIAKETWTDLAVHVKWSIDNDGFWEVWRDGERVAHDETPTLPGTNFPTFQKMGAYRWNDTQTYHLYYDGYWMGITPPPYAQ
jgi:hypothetical protein